MTITTLVVSYTAKDENLWSILQPLLQNGLDAHKNPLMKNLKIWTFRSIRGGDNDSETIQQMFRAPTSAGLLLVSTNACGREYIQQHEWPLFRSTTGKILKPFVALMLSPISFSQVDLGVLGTLNGSASQLMHLINSDGDKFTFQDCLDRKDKGDRVKLSEFIVKLLDDLETNLFTKGLK